MSVYRKDPDPSFLFALISLQILMLVVINVMWMCLMLLLADGPSQSLDVLGTNPLGLTFVLIYGGVFSIQFLALIWHRFATFVQFVAHTPFPGRSNRA